MHKVYNTSKMAKNAPNQHNQGCQASALRDNTTVVVKHPPEQATAAKHPPDDLSNPDEVDETKRR
jgi:hypothetical protein